MIKLKMKRWPGNKASLLIHIILLASKIKTTIDEHTKINVILVPKT